MTKTIRIIDLFAGIGGLKTGVLQGLQQLEYKPEVVFTSEIKKPAIRTLETNYPGITIHGDITQIPETQIPPHELLLAGFPCQAFSTAGRRLGFEDTTKGTLFFDVARILKHHKPNHFILENVEGLIIHDQDPNNKQPIGRTLTTILETLKQLGYNVHWQLISGIEHGIPQNRKRVFITGSLTTQPQPVQPTTTTPPPLKQILETGLTEQNPKRQQFIQQLTTYYTPEQLVGKTLRDKRGGPNMIHSWDFNFKGHTSPDDKNLLETIALLCRQKSFATHKNIPYSERMPINIQDLKERITTQHDPNWDMQEALTRLTQNRYPKEEDNNYYISTGRLSFPIAQILDTNKPAHTVVATDANRLAINDNGNIRTLTPTEFKRLFGFPDTFQLPDTITQNQMFDLFGNSVIVPVAREVTKTLYTSPTA